MAKWNYRIVKIEYEDSGVSYGVETDRGQGEFWYSVFKSPNLDAARKVKEEREAKNSYVPKAVTVIE